eukprot:COSAG06_NODE_6142_length_3089_cov_2.246823_2_plen_46_part_00
MIVLLLAMMKQRHDSERYKALCRVWRPLCSAFFAHTIIIVDATYR